MILLLIQKKEVWYDKVIVYNYEEIITKEEFDKYKIENKCELKGDINGLKENIKLD